MIKQIILPLLGVIAFIILVGILVQKSGSINIPGFSMSSQAQKVVKIDEKTITVEIANTEALREKGLSGRTFLASDSGMLFVFDGLNQTHQFWMKGMLIPLDIIWISGGKIVSINKNVSPPPSGTLDNQLTVYTARGPVDYVLEVAADYSDKNNFKLGDSVDLSGI